MHISSKKLDKLKSILTSQNSCLDFFESLYFNYVRSYGGSRMHLFEDGRVNIVLYGLWFDDDFANWLLTIPNVKEFFKDIKELRFVATDVSITTASKFKSLNPKMLIFHVTPDVYNNTTWHYNDRPDFARGNVNNMGLKPI